MKLTISNQKTFFDGLSLKRIYSYSESFSWVSVLDLAEKNGVEIELVDGGLNREFKVTKNPVLRHDALKMLSEYDHALQLLEWLSNNGLAKFESQEIPGLAMQYAAPGAEGKQFLERFVK